MNGVEEMITVAAPAARARRVLVGGSGAPSAGTELSFERWIAPDITLTPIVMSAPLSPGDRFRLALPGDIGFDYLVEAVSDREVVFSFRGLWDGRERWSFVADGAETIVRRSYEVEERSLVASLAWRTLGRAFVLAHLRLELARFRDAVARDSGAVAELEEARVEQASLAESGRRASFPIDEG